MDYERNWTIEAARNKAINGRWFCAMLFAVNLALFLDGNGLSFATLAVASALPVGLAAFSSRWLMIVSALTVFLTILNLLLTTLSIWWL